MLEDLPRDLQQACSDVIAGQGRRTGLTCPGCHGGRTRERSLGVVYESYGARIHCFRAKCGYTRRVLADGVDVAAPDGRALPRFRSLTEGRTPGALRMALMEARWGLTKAMVARDGILEGPAPCSHILLPIRGPQGDFRGQVAYCLQKHCKPKASTELLNPDDDALAWFAPRGAAMRGTVLVEDQASAIRAAWLGWKAVALLGTSIGTRAELIRTVASGPIVLALDPGAETAAIRQAYNFPWLVVRRLNDDLKRLTNAEILAALA